MSIRNIAGRMGKGPLIAAPAELSKYGFTVKECTAAHAKLSEAFKRQSEVISNAFRLPVFPASIKKPCSESQSSTPRTISAEEWNNRK